MIRKENKTAVIEDNRTHGKDTGSPEVQIAILTTKIKILTEHFKHHKHDYHSRQGLFKMIAKRKKLSEYLKGKSKERYSVLIKELGLRK